MQDFDTPFNPYSTEPKTVVGTGENPVQVKAECCGNVCSPDCVVPQPPDTALVTLQVPVGFRSLDLSNDNNLEPVFDGDEQIGQTPKSGEILEDLTMTIGQLKALVVNRILVKAGNYADTRAVLAQVRKEIS